MLPPATKHLLIINTLCYLAYWLLGSRTGIDISAYLGIWSIDSGRFRLWQPLTYMFMHANFEHLFFNMFSLWMFGTVLEEYWMTRRFVFYYLCCGIGAGLLNMLLPGVHVSVGASGAVYGLLLAFGMLFPRDHIYVYILLPALMLITGLLGHTALGMFLNNYSLLICLALMYYSSATGKGMVRIENRWFIMGMVAVELLLGLFINDGVAHFAHLGGMLIGLLLILYWRKHPFSKI